MARTCVLGLALSSALLAMEGCSTTPTNVSDMQPYATLIGAEYYVAAEGLQAYGMYDGYQNKLGWITLIPGDGIAGPQVAFKRPVAKGKRIRILTAWRQRALLQTITFYEVSLEESDLPKVPVRVELFRGHEGEGIEPNANIYRKLGSS